jgi:hypothetical protein
LSSSSGVAADRRDLQAGGEVIWVAHTGESREPLSTSSRDLNPRALNNTSSKPKDQGNSSSISSFSTTRSQTLPSHSFFGTNLDEYLKSKKIKNLVLAGYQPQCTYPSLYSPHCTDSCILSSPSLHHHNSSLRPTPRLPHLHPARRHRIARSSFVGR